MTWWGNRKTGSNVSVGEEDPTTLIIANKPDWVRLPKELGGDKVKVLRLIKGACPGSNCNNHTVHHYILDSKYGVAECGRAGFLWYKGGPATLGEHGEEQ